MVCAGETITYARHHSGVESDDRWVIYCPFTARSKGRRPTPTASHPHTHHTSIILRSAVNRGRWSHSIENGCGTKSAIAVGVNYSSIGEMPRTLLKQFNQFLLAYLVVYTHIIRFT